MSSRPTYEELELRVTELESETIKLKQIEQELYESQERYRLHFTLANDVMYSLDPQFAVMSVSPSVKKVLGYSPEELIGRPFQELNVLAPDYLENAFNDVTHVLSGKKIDATMYQFITKDGSRRFAEVSGVPLMRDGKAIGVISVARDINARLEMEQSLRESEERFRAIFDSAQDCIFIKDTDLNYTFVNPCMEEFLGQSSSSIVGKKDSDLFGEKVGGHVEKMDRKVLSGEIVKEELTTPVNGEMITFNTIKVPLRNSAGNVMGLCGIARNITERKQFEEVLREKERELELQAKNLEEVNITLNVLLDHREEEKKKAQEDIVEKAKKLIFPYLEKMKENPLSDEAGIYLNIIQSNLEELISSYMSGSCQQYQHLTPMEIQVADLIKQGKTTKEIASLLNVSLPAISFHRANIRKKLGLLHAKTNLRVYLQSSHTTPFQER